MKKKVLFIAALFTAGLSFAQDGLTSKKGVPILPEAGDWAIGFDASNLTSFGANLLNASASNSLNNLDLLNTNTIYGKYFVDANTAYRGMLRLGFGTSKDKTNVPDLTTAGEFVEDEQKTNTTNITIGGGLEYRRGKGRLQGVYGPMALFTLGSSGTETEYGNALSATNNAQRTVENDQGSLFSVAVGGFGGVEYFFAPKISLGAEIAWTINFTTIGDGEMTTELHDGNAVVSTTTESAGENSFGVDTRPNTSISLNFHF